MQKKKWNYFQESEVKGLDTEFVAKLDMARHAAGIQFVIVSGKRTEEHNMEVGGVPDSAHTKGLAADLKVSDSHNLFRMVKSLVDSGINRVGIYFYLAGGVPLIANIHVDDDKTKPQEVIFLKCRGIK
jgi:uncharacterized protein YcbK (DUF882 family)